MEISPERIYLIGLLLIYFLKLKLTCSRVPQNTEDGSLGYIWAMEATHSLKCISSKPVLGVFPCSSWPPLPSQWLVQHTGFRVVAKYNPHSFPWSTRPRGIHPHPAFQFHLVSLSPQWSLLHSPKTPSPFFPPGLCTCCSLCLNVLKEHKNDVTAPYVLMGPSQPSGLSSNAASSERKCHDQVPWPLCYCPVTLLQ